jgi:hypothetical protein
MFGCYFHRRAIDQAFVGTLSPRRWAAVRTHIKACGACRERYEKLGAIGRALGPGGASPMLEEAVLRERPRARLTPWFAGAGLLAAAAALFLFVNRREPGGGFRPRGSPVTFAVRPPGARVLCVGPAGTLGEARLGAEAGAPLRCPLHASLQIVHSSAPERRLAMIAFGVDERGERRWYAPRQPDAPPVAVEGDFLDLPLDWSTSLEVKHQAGKIDLTVRWVDVGPGTAAEALEAAPVLELHAALLLEAP